MFERILSRTRRNTTATYFHVRNELDNLSIYPSKFKQTLINYYLTQLINKHECRVSQYPPHFLIHTEHGITRAFRTL